MISENKQPSFCAALMLLVAIFLVFFYRYRYFKLPC